MNFEKGQVGLGGEGNSGTTFVRQQQLYTYVTTVTNLLQNPGCRSREEQNKVTVKSKIKVSKGLGDCKE